MKSISRLVIVLCIIVLLIVSQNMFNNIETNDSNNIIINNKTNKKLDNISNLSNISAPKQELISNKVKERVIVGDKNVNITKLAKYDISGVVIQKNEHKGEVGSFDVTLAWGILTVDDNYKKISIWNSGSREITWTVKDTQWSDSIGGSDALMDKLSNNHLIPSTNELRNEFSKIKIGNYIRIKGYLVLAQWDNTTWGPSSLSRTDTDCEIIYVEYFEWLK